MRYLKTAAFENGNVPQTYVVGIMKTKISTLNKMQL